LLFLGPQLCNDNRYVTTLHCINSAIVKLGRLSKPSTVYRGLSGSVLPRQFWKGHGQGGVEFAFMSTTANRKVAMDYAKSKNASNTPATVMEIQMGMIDRGADLAWLSQVMIPPTSLSLPWSHPPTLPHLTSRPSSLAVSR